MAKKKSKSQAKATPVVDAIPAQDEDESETTATQQLETKDTNNNNGNDNEGEEEEAMELLQVDVGDIIKLKQVLDETVASAMVDGEPKLTENFSVENAKLLVMTLACGFAMVAQFAPLPFPDSRIALGGCCAAYFVLSGVLQLIVTFWERDIILLTQPAGEKGQYEKKEVGLRVRSHLPRFEEFYTVMIEYNEDESSESNSSKKLRPFVKQTWSVGKFFDVEGFFDEIFLMEEVEKLCKRFEKRQYDKDDTEDAVAAKTKKNN